MSAGVVVGVLAAVVVVGLLAVMGVGLARMYRAGHSRAADFTAAPVGVGFLRDLSSRLVDTESTRSIEVGLDVLDSRGTFRRAVHKQWMGPGEHASYVGLPVGTMMPVRWRADGSAIVSPADLPEAERLWREERQRAGLLSAAQAAAIERGTPARATVERVVESEAAWHDLLVGFDVRLTVTLPGGAERAAVTRVFAPRDVGFAALRAGERVDVRISSGPDATVVLAGAPASELWTPDAVAR
jgi:hypothetical protein